MAGRGTVRRGVEREQVGGARDLHTTIYIINCGIPRDVRLSFGSLVRSSQPLNCGLGEMKGMVWFL